MKSYDEVLNELATKQRKNIQANKRLQYTDLKRIAKNIKYSIFNKDNCCIWNGYITNLNNSAKGVYINFYFRGKKSALHRLLYINYVDDLKDDEYIKYSCTNKGKCCNINHIVKHKYTEKNNKEEKKVETEKKQIIQDDVDEDSFIIKF